MQGIIETKRLVIRPFHSSDSDELFKLDADPEVMRYLPFEPVQSIDMASKVIARIISEYENYGVGRLVVEEKSSGEFLGWSGLKWINDKVNGRSDFYDLGYRFHRRFWGKGYATESARASLDYGFNTLDLKEICAIAEVENVASNKILTKIGMKRQGTFSYENLPHYFYTCGGVL